MEEVLNALKLCSLRELKGIRRQMDFIIAAKERAVIKEMIEKKECKT